MALFEDTRELRALSEGSHTARVQAAIQNTPEEYLSQMFNMRSAHHPENAGSVLDKHPHEIRDVLMSASWEPHDHPDIQSPASGFKANIPGRMGIVPLSSLDPSHPVDLEDPKGTGQVSAVASDVPGDRTQVGHTTMILGPRRDGNGEQVWTFHPGDPIRPSEVPASAAGGTTAGEAAKMGFDYAKVRR